MTEPITDTVVLEHAMTVIGTMRKTFEGVLPDYVNGAWKEMALAAFCTGMRAGLDSTLMTAELIECDPAAYARTIRCLNGLVRSATMGHLDRMEELRTEGK